MKQEYSEQDRELIYLACRIGDRLPYTSSISNWPEFVRNNITKFKFFGPGGEPIIVEDWCAWIVYQVKKNPQLLAKEDIPLYTVAKLLESDYYTGKGW